MFPIVSLRSTFRPAITMSYCRGFYFYFPRIHSSPSEKAKKPEIELLYVFTTAIFPMVLLVVEPNRIVQYFDWKYNHKNTVWKVEKNVAEIKEEIETWNREISTRFS